MSNHTYRMLTPLSCTYAVRPARTSSTRPPASRFNKSTRPRYSSLSPQHANPGDALHIAVYPLAIACAIHFAHMRTCLAHDNPLLAMLRTSQPCASPHYLTYLRLRHVPLSNPCFMYAALASYHTLYYASIVVMPVNIEHFSRIYIVICAVIELSSCRLQKSLIGRYTSCNLACIWEVNDELLIIAWTH